MEVAALGLKIDGIADVDKAASSLDAFTKAGQGAANAAKGVGAASGSAAPQIDKAALAEKRLAEEAAKAGISVGQMKAALRGVPAQFTDIAVSLQGGMNPLTVFLQQGGQLKDMFGSAAGAARALGGYVIGLINPLTTAAAAMAALGVAYYQGSKEQDAFLKAIALTGNASGVTASQLRAYAQEMDGVSGTQAKAAESLAIFVNAGVSGDNMLKQYTQTAIAWEKATGEGVDVVAQKFAALQKDPVTATLKLNESMNFLTATTYDQITALEEQGRTTEAAEVAMNALDAAMAQRSKTIESNLGYIQRGWNAVTGAAKQAWDAMLNIGRAQALDEKLVSAQEALRKMESEGAGLFERGTYQKRLKAQRELVSSLEQQSAAEAMNAAVQKQNAEEVAYRTEIDKKYARQLKQEVSLAEQLATARTELTKAGKDEATIVGALAKITEEYNKKQPKPKKGRTGSASAGVSELANIMSRVHATNQLIEAMQKQGKEADKITEGERLAYKLQQEIDSGKLKGAQLVAKQRQLEAAKQLQTAQESLEAEKKRQKEAEKAAEREKAAAIDRANLQFQLQEQLTASQQRYDSQTAAYGMGDQAAANAQARISLIEKQQQELRQLTHEHGQEMRKAESDADRQHLQEMFAERMTLTRSAQGQELMQYDSFIQQKKELDQNWMLGVQSALATYVETSTNAYANAKDATLSMARTVEGAFTTLFTLGESSAKNFFKTILQGIAQIAAQQASSGLAGMFGKLISGAIGGGIGGGGSSLYSLAGGGSGLGLSFGGFRANGGDVTKGSFYRVNEKFPELMTVGNRDYLMMGGQSGYVTPLTQKQAQSGGGGGMGNVTIVNQTTGKIDKVEQKQLTPEEVVLIIQEQTPRIMVSETQNASSPFSRTMQNSFNTSRRR